MLHHIIECPSAYLQTPSKLVRSAGLFIKKHFVHFLETINRSNVFCYHGRQRYGCPAHFIARKQLFYFPLYISILLDSKIEEQRQYPNCFQNNNGMYAYCGCTGSKHLNHLGLSPCCGAFFGLFADIGQTRWGSRYVPVVSSRASCAGVQSLLNGFPWSSKYVCTYIYFTSPHFLQKKIKKVHIFLFALPIVDRINLSLPPTNRIKITKDEQ